MHNVFRMLLFWGMLLSACSAIPAPPQTVPPETTKAPPIVPTTPVASIPGECGYQWAYQDLPELSSSFQESIQRLQPEAQADAYIFGENCILSDGSIGAFLPRETDFNISLQVRDLNDESALGGWIVKVMQVITEIPAEQIVGPVPGQVFLVFQSGSDQRAINFGIDEFRKLPANLSEAEIFQALEQPQ